MSKRHRKSTPTIQRKAPMGQGSTVIPITPAIQAQMQQQMAPQAKGSPMYPPGAPIQPVEGLTPFGPRQFQYPVGININSLPRSTELNSFDTLRSLATMYYGIQLCEQVWFNTTAKLKLVVEPIPELVAEGEPIPPDLQQAALKYQQFFEFPDKPNGMDLKSWMKTALRDQLELDALAIYVRKNRDGTVASLEIVDGSTIKVLVDVNGRLPQPPFPAYMQYLYGVPAMDLTIEDLLYHKEVPRSDSSYGLSRVERIILIVNQALRKQNRDLAKYTDGNIPAGLMEVPESANFTVDQIESYEAMWNNFLAGNDQARARVKFTMPGMKYIRTDDGGIETEFDSWLLNITVACFGMTMAELAITENVNKSSGDSQENVFYRNSVAPVVDGYANLFTQVLRDYFHDARFIVRWKGFEEGEDLGALASAYSALVNAGIMSASEAAKELHRPVPYEVDPWVMTKNGPVSTRILMDPEVQQAQKKALLLAANPPQPTAQSQPDDSSNEREVHTEYRRWRDVAIKDAKVGRRIRAFKSDIIPQPILDQMTGQLQRLTTPEEVRDLFHATYEAKLGVRE